MKKTVVKTYVESTEYNYPKARRKELEKGIFDAIANAQGVTNI